MLQPLNEFAEGSGAGFKKQVHVIRHQAVGADSEAELCAIVFQAVEVRLIVVVATKRFSSLIAAHDDVVQQTWRTDSGTAGHGGRAIKNQSVLQDCSDCYV